jgi:hypothetical protein
MLRIKIISLAVLLYCLFSSGFAQSKIESIWLHGQSPINEYLFWQDLREERIQSPFILPAIESEILLQGPRQMYQRWHTAGNLPVAIRVHASYQANQRLSGIRQTYSGTAKFSMNESIFIQNDFELDSDGLMDAHNSGSARQALGSWTAYLQHSSMSYMYDQGQFILGRGNVYSSLLGNSLLINQYIPPAEYIYWHHKKDNMSFDWVVKSLDSLNAKNRFLSLHRYAIEKSTWRFGFSEMIMVDYKSLSSEQIGYLLPASIFYDAQINGGANANIMFGFDFLVKYKKHTFRGELLIDDYALDGDSPAKIGYKLGIGRAGSLVDVYSEYTRINRWTGNYYYPELRYVENDVLIGSPLGPDTHSFKVKLFKQFSDHLNTRWDLSWTESGSGNIYEWPAGITNNQNFAYSHEPFPSRPITSEYEASLTIDYFVNARVNTAISIDMSSIRSTSMQFFLRLAL